jgi:hypothetical protein
LRAFLRSDGSDYDWAGALMIAELLDDIQYIRKFAQSYAKAMGRKARSK